PHGAVDLGAKRFVGIVDQNAHLVVVAEREHLGCFLHAEGVPLAEISIHENAHAVPPKLWVSVIRETTSTTRLASQLLALAPACGAALRRRPDRGGALLLVGRLVQR